MKSEPHLEPSLDGNKFCEALRTLGLLCKLRLVTICQAPVCHEQLSIIVPFGEEVAAQQAWDHGSVTVLCKGLIQLLAWSVWRGREATQDRLNK